VQVNVGKTGTFEVVTDTVNGFYFRAVGTFTKLGATTVTLRGNGTPFSGGISNFVVKFDTTFCDIQVNVISPGIGTLAGSPNACAPITVNGGYSPGVALNSGNNAVVQVNVTTAGLINITTDTVAGIWFSYSGSLPLGTGQNVTLTAHGSIPATTANGPQTYKVRLGTSLCTFVVTIAAPAAGTVDCTGAVVFGPYAPGVPLIASDSIRISVNVLTAGAYNITTDTVNGIWFNTSGIFSATGITPLILVGHGTPTHPGSFTYTVRFGASSCTFQVVCTGWEFNIGTTVYKGYSSSAAGDISYDNTSFPPISFLNYVGFNAALDELDFDFLDLAGGITAAETYNTNSLGAANAADFYFNDIAGTISLQADATQIVPPANIIYTVTSHNTTTKTMIGTFSGTAFDTVSGTIKFITSGAFAIVYP
jgi:hypothetical protein